MPTVDTGTGAQISFATSGWTAEFTSASIGTIRRPVIDTTHMRTTQASAGQFGGRTYMPGKLVDLGYLNLECHFNANNPPPIHGDVEAITITYPTSPFIATPGQTRFFAGFVTRYDVESRLEDKMVARVEVKLSGLAQNVSPTNITSSPDVSTCLTSGLIAFWNLGEVTGATRLDSTANNLDLTDNNTVTQETGKIGDAAGFVTANSESLTLAGASASLLSFGDTDFTITAWVYITSAVITSILVSKGTPLPTIKNMEYQLAYNASTGRLQFAVGNGTSYLAVEQPGLPASTNTWYFMGCRHDAANNSVSLVINDATSLPSSGSWIGGSYASGLDFAIGKYGSYAGGYASARVDAVGVWNCLLSDTDLLYLYNSGAGREYPLV